jgi:hypothetical protein
MVAERPGRPAGEALDFITDRALNPDKDPSEAAAPDLGSQLRQVFTGMSRFMRSLSN